MTTKSMVESARAEDMRQFLYHLDPYTRKITRSLQKVKSRIKTCKQTFTLAKVKIDKFCNNLSQQENDTILSGEVWNKFRKKTLVSTRSVQLLLIWSKRKCAHLRSVLQNCLLTVNILENSFPWIHHLLSLFFNNLIIQIEIIIIQ